MHMHSHTGQTAEPVTIRAKNLKTAKNVSSTQEQKDILIMSVSLAAVYGENNEKRRNSRIGLRTTVSR